MAELAVEADAGHEPTRATVVASALVDLLPGTSTAMDAPQFPRAGWGHRGYESEPVDAFVAAAHRRVAGLEEQVSDLRGELDRLHQYLRREWSAALRPEGSRGESAERDALARAQQVADDRLAEADRRLLECTALAGRHIDAATARAAGILGDAQREAEARLTEAQAGLEAVEVRAAQRLAATEAMAEQALAHAWQEAAHSGERAAEAARQAVGTIRQQYQDIVVRAHQRADRAAANAVHDLEQHAASEVDPARARAELQLRAAYLNTAAEVSRTAMRAALALADREFDKLLADEA